MTFWEFVNFADQCKNDPFFVYLGEDDGMVCAQSDEFRSDFAQLIQLSEGVYHDPEHS